MPTVDSGTSAVSGLDAETYGNRRQGEWRRVDESETPEVRRLAGPGNIAMKRVGSHEGQSLARTEVKETQTIDIDRHCADRVLDGCRRREREERWSELARAEFSTLRSLQQ